MSGPEGGFTHQVIVPFVQTAPAFSGAPAGDGHVEAGDRPAGQLRPGRPRGGPAAASPVASRPDRTGCT